MHIPLKRRRFVFLHHHIMKNAGTTVARILRREFPTGFLEMDSEHYDGEITAGELVTYLEENPNIQAVSSHQIRFPRIEDRQIVAFECCIIRHPYDRLQSLYRYLCALDTGLPIGRVARENEFPGFLKTLLDRHPHLICNVQTTILSSGGRFIRPADSEDLRNAIATICKIAVPGVVNRFDESMASAEYFLQPAFPNLQLHSKPENVTESTAISIGEREREFRSACGDRLFGEVHKMQELDLQLFRAAEEEVFRRTALIPGFEFRLQNLRMRGRLAYATAAA